MESERRSAERQDAVIVVALDEEGLLGVTRDVSASGLRIATQFRCVEGDHISLVIHRPTGAHRTTATVVRVVETPPEAEWRYLVAVRVDTPVPEDAIEAGATAALTLLK